MKTGERTTTSLCECAWVLLLLPFQLSFRYQILLFLPLCLSMCFVTLCCYRSLVREAVKYADY